MSLSKFGLPRVLGSNLFVGSLALRGSHVGVGLPGEMTPPWKNTTAFISEFLYSALGHTAGQLTADRDITGVLGIVMVRNRFVYNAGEGQSYPM